MTQPIRPYRHNTSLTPRPQSSSCIAAAAASSLSNVTSPNQLKTLLLDRQLQTIVLDKLVIPELEHIRMSAEAGSPQKPTETASASLQELQETVSRLSSHAGVDAVLILNRQGDIIAESSKTKQTTSDEETSPSVDGASMVSKLLKLATTYIKTLSPDDEISFLQVRTEQHRELYIAPHEGYVLALARR